MMFGSDSDEPETRTLKQAKWRVDVEKTYTVVEERLVWSGGAEKIVEHCPYHGMYDTLYDVDENVVLDVQQQPAYTERLAEWKETCIETKRREAWIAGDIPPGVEETGDSKTVIVNE